MTYSSCPTALILAPADVVWTLLTEPAGWGSFFDVRVTGIDPAGPAAVGQRIFGESGPRFLHLRLTFAFTEVDAAQYKLGLNVQLPLGITVREELRCLPLGPAQCRVNYHCAFAVPKGWRGAISRLVLRREFDAGPVESLSRLKLAAERRQGVCEGCHVAS